MSGMSTGEKEFGRLKWAILHGEREVIDSLLEKNTPVDNLCHIKDFRPPLHSSVHLGDPSIVRKLLDKGASVNVLDWNNETALTLAAKYEKHDIVDLLLSNEELKNCANKENFSHLHIACMRNRVDVVKKFIEKETNVNTSVCPKSIRWPGFTPLHFAVQSQSIETVAFLLSVGADITIQNSNLLTALHLADMIRNIQIIDMILVAHKGIARNPVNSEGLSHFHIACSRNDVEVVECFLKNQVALDGSVHKRSLNWTKYTAIEFAIYYDCADVLKLLLLEGNRRVFPSKCESRNLVTMAYCSGNTELVELLLQRDELREQKITDIQKLPSLHFSCIYDDIDAIKNAFEYFPNDLNTSAWQGSTPLHLAVERGDEKIIEYLLDQGADYNIENANGKTPLHIAFEHDLKDSVKLMLSNLDRITANPMDRNGFSHLHIACIRNNAKAIKRFIALGCDMNAPVNIDSAIWPGFTPIHFAAKFVSLKAARVLLKNGASYVAPDKFNMTAFDIAIFEFREFYQKNIYKVLDLLREILSCQEKHRIDSFNDRGFSLLHVIYPGIEDSLHVAHDDFRRDLRKFIEDHPGDLNKAVHKMNTPWDGYTPLHFAMLDIDPRYAAFFVKMGADLWSKAANGDTPMHLASMHYIMPDVPDETVDFDEVLHNPVGHEGESLFHVACSAGNKEWVEYFLNHGVDPNSRNTVQGLEFYDKTPLHMVTRGSHRSKFQIMKLLLERGADATILDHHLNTPLHWIMSCVHPKTIELLIDHGVDVNFRNAFLETPLLKICKDNKFFFTSEQLGKIIESLLNNGADINLANEQGITPLSVDAWTSSDFAFNHNLPAIRVLLRHVIRLQKMGSYVSDANEQAFSSLVQRGTVEFRSSLTQFCIQCEDEFELLRGVRTDIYMTLYDVLFQNLDGLAVISGYHEFKQMVHSDDFMAKYPIYGPILKLQWRRGRERRPLLANAEKVLKFLINIPIPRECLGRILQFLTNEDLKNVIISNS